MFNYCKIFFFTIMLCHSVYICAKENPAATKQTYVVGHINPDTDAIASAIAAGYYFNATAVRPGEINQETKFLLNYFKLPTPVLQQNFADSDVIVVDTNQKTQVPASILTGNSNLIGIIDHHALQDQPLTTQSPINIDIKPWGSTCTILAKNYFLRNNKQIPKPIAGMMLGAIISDTLNLRSATTTPHDKEMLAYLATIAGVDDVDAFAQKMFTAKSDVSQLTDAQVMQTDYKLFTISKHKVGVAVVETMLPEQILQRKPGLISAAREIKTKQGLDLLFFFVVDTKNLNSKLLLIGKQEITVAQKAFGGTPSDSVLDTQNNISRKLQIIPVLQHALIVPTIK